MTSRTRLIVMSISAPVIAFAIVGGFLGRVMAREDTYQHLKVFDDVVGMITSNYVEEVNVDKVMHGAMHGLADGLDPDSAYLSPQQVKQVESGAALAAGRRRPRADAAVLPARHRGARQLAGGEGRPAHRRLRPRDRQPCRRARCRSGKACARCAARRDARSSSPIIRGNAADPHVVELTREAFSPSDVTGRIAAPGVGYVRIAAIGPKTAEQVKNEVGDLTKSGATKLIVDVRRTSSGALDDGLAIARLFVGKGTLAMREAKGAERARPSRRPPATARSRCRRRCSIDTGTSGAAELFAAALSGNQRADLIGERTIGRAAHAETDQAARWQRPLAVDHALSHAGGRAAARKGSRAHGRRSTSRTSSSASRRRRPIRRSKRRSSVLRRKRPRSQ